MEDKSIGRIVLTLIYRNDPIEFYKSTQSNGVLKLWVPMQFKSNVDVEL